MSNRGYFSDLLSRLRARRGAADGGRDGGAPLARIEAGVADRAARTEAASAQRADGLASARARLRFPPDAPSNGWFGGAPRLPAGLAWPEIDGEPLHFLAQIDCAALPAELWGGIGPRRGWLCLFVGALCGEDGYPARGLLFDAPGPEREGPSALGADWFTLGEAGFDRSPRWPVAIALHRAGEPDPAESCMSDDADSDVERGWRANMDLRDPAFQPFDWPSAALMAETAEAAFAEAEARIAAELADAEEKAAAAERYRAVIAFHRDAGAAARAELAAAGPAAPEPLRAGCAALAMRLWWAHLAVERGPCDAIATFIEDAAARDMSAAGVNPPPQAELLGRLASGVDQLDADAARLGDEPARAAALAAHLAALRAARAGCAALRDDIRARTAEPFTAQALAPVIAALGAISAPSLRTCADPSRGPHARRWERSGAAATAPGGPFDWKPRFEARARQRALALWLDRPQALPEALRARLEGYWAQVAAQRVAAMGAPPFGHDWRVDPRDPETVVLIELPTIEPLGWRWGDLYSLVVSMPRADLAAGRFDRLVASVSNG